MRLGHPARLLSAVQEHSLDALLSNSEGTAIVRDVRKDIDETLVGQKYIVSLALNHVDWLPVKGDWQMVRWKLKGLLAQGSHASLSHPLHLWHVLYLGESCLPVAPLQAWIHTPIGFHCFTEIGQIFHNKYIFSEKLSTFQVENWKWFGQSVNILSECLRNVGKLGKETLGS